MKTSKIIYESGATSHAVNDLILLADNTRETVDFRDNIYNKAIKYNYSLADLMGAFKPLYGLAVNEYRKCFPNLEDHQHVRNMSKEDINEFCLLYAKEFENWKLDHDIK